MIQLYKYLPTIDLHGYDRDYARILINDFIEEQYKLRQEKIIIIHGNGSGILKKMTQELLRKNKRVESFKIDNFNTGMTVVSLKKSVDF
jgi:DNA mismatch repair protein MutS2